MSDLVKPNRAKRDRMLNILLIDDDPIFRLGLRLVLGQLPDLELVAEAQSANDTREILASSQVSINVVILNLSLGSVSASETSGLELASQLKNLYPHLPILLLGEFTQPVLLTTARQIGIEGYCRKGTGPTELVDAIRLVGTGQFYWSQPSVVQMPESQLESSQPKSQAGFLPTVLNNIRLSGLRQIEASLTEVTAELQNARLSLLDRAILAGRQRELKAARSILYKLLGKPVKEAGEGENGKVVQRQSEKIEEGQRFDELAITYQQLPVRSRSELFDRTFANLQYGVTNLTPIPLEIDIFREEKKRELLTQVLRKLEGILDDLRFSQVQPEQLPEKKSVILLDLWQATATDFFGKYYTLKLGDQDLEIVNILLQDATIVYSEILEKIPLVIELFSHLLFTTPLTIDNLSYEMGTPEAMFRAELLLDNLVIQVGNGIVQPLLNHFADVEMIKQTFYDRRLISTREIERFRNNLSWKYRLEKYVGEPRAIFESKYLLFVLDGGGIRKISIYAPRAAELEQLSGIQFAVTLALESRDAIAPRLNALVSFVGSGVIYLLTQVIGRGIGLIGRGILEGIGNSLQESRVGKNGDRK